MLYSSRRSRKTKAIAEVLAMIASARELEPRRDDATADAEESPYKGATEFCAALEQYAALTAHARASQLKSAPLRSIIAADVTLDLAGQRRAAAAPRAKIFCISAGGG